MKALFSKHFLPVNNSYLFSMFAISIICGCIGHFNTCPGVPFEENVLNLAEVFSVLPCIALLLILGVKSVFEKKKLRSSAEFVSTDVLAQPITETNLDPVHLPFSNFSPRKGYLALFWVTVLVLLVTLAFY